MFCRKCGAELPDGSAFCDKCGESTVADESRSAEGEAAYASAGTGDKLSSRYRLIGMAAVGAAAVIVIAVVCAIAFGGRSSREVVDDFIEAVYEDPDAEDFVELFPRQAARTLFGVTGSLDYNISEYYIENIIDGMRGGLRGEQKVRYDIVKNEKYDRDELEKLRTELTDEYGIRPSAAREVTVSYTVRSANETGSVELKLIKLGRSWYLIDFNDSPEGSIGPVI